MSDGKPMFIESVSEMLEEAAKLFGSPIEEKFFVSLLDLLRFGVDANILVASQDPRWFWVWAPHMTPDRASLTREIVMIELQPKIEDMRADFWVHVAGVAGTPQVIVECDGHDFHERTKEQAKRDRSRDRRMATLGYVVMRFTGSELHADSLGCAKDVAKLFLSRMKAGPKRG